MGATPRLAPVRSAPRPRTRPHLEVVAPPRRRIGGPVVVVVTIVVFVVLLGTAGLNTVIVARQRQLDQVDTQISEGSTRNEALRLEVAQLESPGRIVESARAAGMDIPDEVTWLAPRADGGAEASTAERATGPDTEADGADDGTTDDGTTDDGQGDEVDERASGPTTEDGTGSEG
jgi:cell division protein FtsL